MNATSSFAMPNPGRLYYYPGMLLDIIARCIAEPSLFVIGSLTTASIIVITTRIWTGRGFSSIEIWSEGQKSVPVVPYWLPFIGSLFAFIVDPDEFLRKSRNQTIHGVFNLNLASTSHNIVCTPSLIKAVFSNRLSYDPTFLHLATMRSMFGIAPKYADMIGPYVQDIANLTGTELMKEPGLTNMIMDTVEQLEERIPDMVSFTANVVDQNVWERTANMKIGSDSAGKYAEASLFQMLRHFIGQVSSKTLMGETFIRNYPGFLQDVFDLDDGFKWLLMGLPRYVPIPTLTRAHIARRRLHQNIAALYHNLDLEEAGEKQDPEWRHLEDVSKLLRGRNGILRDKVRLPVEIRGGCDSSLLWAMNVNANNLCFWMMVRILANPDLHTRLLVEISPYIHLTTPPPIGSFAASPSMRMNLPGLTNKCPLLKACYFEALRLDSQPWSVKKLMSDITLTETADEVRAGGQPETYLLRKGSYLEIPHELHHMDPRYFPNPRKFDPDRFLKPSEENPGELVCEIGHLRVYGGGDRMCRGRFFAERECYAFVAGILRVWDIEPVSKKGWVIPGHKKATAVCIPTEDLRVRIRMRKTD